jgi:hypothetical protein
MKFSYHPSPDLPPLAWVATVQVGTSIVRVTHGRFVDTHPHVFVEGAWAGDFEAGRIQDADTVFGSGAGLADGSAVFASCTATTDFLYHGGDAGRFAVSNSLPLLLACLGDALQPACPAYGRINRSILDGIRQYRAEIPTLKGHVNRVMHRNIRIDAAGVTLVEKPLPPRFRQFEAYRDFMRARIGALFANARHPARQHPMQVFSTQSRGYDSTAVNALAAPYGIDKVFTSPQSKEHRSFYLGGQVTAPDDDGTPICEALGLTCVAIDRLSFREGLDEEPYYWAGLDNNTDLNLHPIHAYLDRPTLLLTGNLGEIWYTSEAIGKARLPTFNDELIRWDQAGHGLGEVRLTSGMVQAAVPFIGARNRRDILDITDDPSMDAYRLGGGYDRPIPRRIAEEAGVPRNLFGQAKLASVVQFPTPNLPVTASLRAEYFRHLRQHRLLGRLGIALLPLVQRINNWIYWQNPGRRFNDRRRHPLLWHIGYAWSKLSGRPLRIRTLWPHLDAFLYAFCVNRTANDYAQQLARSQATDVDAVAVSAPGHRAMRG